MGSMTQPDENRALASLLTRCAHHDTSALARFYEFTGPWIYALLRRRTTSRALADDAMVAVYSEVWRRAASYAGLERSVLAWTTAIAYETTGGYQVHNLSRSAA